MADTSTIVGRMSGRGDWAVCNACVGQVSPDSLQPDPILSGAESGDEFSVQCFFCGTELMEPSW